MNSRTQLVHIGGVLVQMVHKAIKHLHLGVYPPDGHVRLAVPLRVNDEAARRMVLGKLDWIKRHQARLLARPRPPARELVSGESHHILGQRCRLEVIYHSQRAGRVALNAGTLELHVPLGASTAQREQVLQHWYRHQLNALIPPLAEKWSKALGVQAAEWRVKKMKTKWGTCNIKARRIWLNLELARRPLHCVEYVVVHELAHLIERRHDARFKAVMDRHCPQWRAYRKELNAAPMAHEARAG
jgi:hypothetical protein